MREVFLGAIGSIIATLVVFEAGAWWPRLISTALRMAVVIAPADHRERLAEEWEAYIGDVPGAFGKVVALVGMINAASKLPSQIANVSTARVRLAWRLLDLYLAVMAIVFTLPILVVSALLIKLSSSGPVFVAEKRIGMDGKSFKLYKFRSVNHAAAGEPLTLVGRWLAATSIDELPQIYNVLLGDMSIIGPRPGRGSNEFDKRYYTQIKPGLAPLEGQPKLTNYLSSLWKSVKMAFDHRD